jgi:hypothetical protein
LIAFEQTGEGQDVVVKGRRDSAGSASEIVVKNKSKSTASSAATAAHPNEVSAVTEEIFISITERQRQRV